MLQGLCGTTIGLIISAVCKTQQDATQIGKKYIHKGPSINDATHLGEIADLPKGDVSPFVYLVKWVTRAEEGVKKWVTSF